MGNPPSGFVMVSQRKYEQYALSLGLHPAGTHLIVGGVTVGWRTNKRVYVDPMTYAKVFGRPPVGSSSLEYALNEEPSDVESEIPKNARTCPTCKHVVASAPTQIDFKCLNCGTAFRY